MLFDRTVCMKDKDQVSWKVVLFLELPNVDCKVNIKVDVTYLAVYLGQYLTLSLS